MKVRIKNGSEVLLFSKLNVFHERACFFVQCLMRTYYFTAMKSSLVEFLALFQNTYGIALS